MLAHVHVQRATALSRDGSLLAVGNTDGTVSIVRSAWSSHLNSCAQSCCQMAVFTFPDLQPLALKHRFLDDEIYDLDFNDSGTKVCFPSLRHLAVPLVLLDSYRYGFFVLF